MLTRKSDLMVVYTKSDTERLRNELRVLLMKDSKPTGKCLNTDIHMQHCNDYPKVLELYDSLGTKVEEETKN